jgi:ectoine hydroxylase-related dioxygenase (phytanoyl-CoA dioxygenase family)
MISPRALERFHEEGYCVVDVPIPPALLSELRRAADAVTERTQAGGWPHRRNWPYKHFKGKNDFWGVSHLLHPDLGEPAFARYVAQPAVLAAAADLLGCPSALAAGQLQLEYVNLLVNPSLDDFEIAWHRDVVRGDPDPEEEAATLAVPRASARWNFALYDDPCLWVIPGSHRRPKGPREREVCRSRAHVGLPGEMRICLGAGQAVYYDPDLLHRGVYPRDRLRRTLHCDLGLGTDPRHQDALYQSLEWMAQDDVRPTLPETLHPYHENFLRRLRAYQRAEAERIAAGSPSPEVAP